VLHSVLREAGDDVTNPPGPDGGAHGNGRPHLTPRQREVLRLLAEGLSMREAGLVLNITPRTVAFHKYQMMAQLDLKSNAALIQYAVRNGIV
jgi:DNA-binding CsgD family transcriptional regulator